MAYVLRFVKNVKAGIKDWKYGLFSTEELFLAETTLYKHIQFESFREELVIIRWNETARLNKQKEFDKSNFIRMCSPISHIYLDEHGVMRMKGRIDAATSISISVKRPIILAKNHYVTKLIVDYYHRKYLHMNYQTVL